MFLCISIVLLVNSAQQFPIIICRPLLKQMHSFVLLSYWVGFEITLFSNSTIVLWESVQLLRDCPSFWENMMKSCGVILRSLLRQDSFQYSWYYSIFSQFPFSLNLEILREDRHFCLSILILDIIQQQQQRLIPLGGVGYMDSY